MATALKPSCCLTFVSQKRSEASAYSAICMCGPRKGVGARSTTAGCAAPPQNARPSRLTMPSDAGANCTALRIDSCSEKHASGTHATAPELPPMHTASATAAKLVGLPMLLASGNTMDSTAEASAAATDCSSGWSACALRCSRRL